MFTVTVAQGMREQVGRILAAHPEIDVVGHEFSDGSTTVMFGIETLMSADQVRGVIEAEFPYISVTIEPVDLV